MKRITFKISSHAIKINGVIANVIKAYRKKHIPIPQLLKDYSSLLLEDSHAMNCWVEHQQEEHLPYERGATVAESLMLTIACLLEGERPTDVIRAAFYNKRNNDSAFECDVLQRLFAKLKNDALSVVIHPSPDFLIKDFEEDAKTIYLVPDLLVAKLYRKEFATDQILAFEEATSLPPIGNVLIMQRQYRDLEKLLSSLQFLTTDAVVMAFLNHKDIKGSASPFWSELSKSSLHVRSAIRIDSAVVSTPKRKVLLTISQVSREAVDIWDSQYDEKNKQLQLFGPVRQISSARFHNGGISWAGMVNGPKAPKTSQIRKPATVYNFSDEIKLSYTEKTDKCGTPKIKACYYSLQHASSNQKGQKLTNDVIHRVGKSRKEGILEGVPFESTCRSHISADVRNYYTDSLNQLSLKTHWFLCISSLESDREYNHAKACELFTGNNALAQIRLQSSTESDIIKAVESIFNCKAEDITYSYWRQLDLIIKKIIRSDFATSNPLENYVASRSNRLTQEQREVRDALVKKCFEPNEMQKIVEYLSSENNPAKKCVEDSSRVAAWLKLLTGMSNGELCALRWSDYIKLDYSLGRQLRITKYASSNGIVTSYGIADEPKIRNIPIVPELQFILDSFYRHIRNSSGLSSKEISQTPIITSSFKDGEFKPFTPRKMNNLCKKILNVAGIAPEVITLHDGDTKTDMDLSSYKADFFKSNAYHYFRCICNIPDGEACYLIGATRPTTFERNYLDYANDFIQYRMMQEMRRGLACYDSLMGLPHNKHLRIGNSPIHEHQDIASDGHHVSTSNILFPNGCKAGTTLSINALHGLHWNCSFEKEDTK